MAVSPEKTPYSVLSGEPEDPLSGSFSPHLFGPWQSPTVPFTEHLALLEGRRVVGGKLRHRKANPRCTFCALEFHSLTPNSSLGGIQ